MMEVLIGDILKRLDALEARQSSIVCTCGQISATPLEMWQHLEVWHTKELPIVERLAEGDAARQRLEEKLKALESYNDAAQARAEAAEAALAAVRSIAQKMRDASKNVLWEPIEGIHIEQWAADLLGCLPSAPHEDSNACGSRRPSRFSATGHLDA